MRFLLFLSSIMLSAFSFSQKENKAIVTIKGFAPTYVGQSIDILKIEDYITLKESKIANGIVKEDSTFSISFYTDETQKIRLKAGNNKSYMYIQPNGKYDVYFPEKDKYDPYRPAGNNVELTFFNLDSTDINYKILQYNRWADNVVGQYFYKRLSDPVEFNTKMDEFKANAQAYYIKDTGTYIYDYVRFSLASLDNIQQAGQRGRYEKHDFYLKYSPVQYNNDAYMDYFKSFYERMIPRLTMEVNNRVYLGVLKSSPTLVMKALGMDYTLVNMRIREMVMINSLGEVYFSDDFPQTNIITILDSVANHGMFEANKLIAKNMKERLTELVSGGKAPAFTMQNREHELVTNSDYKGKHVYLHFFDPSSEKNRIEIPLFKLLYERYGNDVTILTICPDKSYTEEEMALLNDLEWETFIVDQENSIWSNYNIKTFPNYVLLDKYSYVIAAPALGPQPNGEYETIDYTFFMIQKMNRQEERN